MDKNTLIRIGKSVFSAMKNANGTEWYNDWDIWGWNVGVALFGVLKMHETTKDEEYLEFITSWIDAHCENFNANSPNAAAPLNAVLYAYLNTGNDKYMEIIKQFVDWGLSKAKRTPSGAYSHVWGDDPDDGPRELQIWVDTLFMAALFISNSGAKLENKSCEIEGVQQFRLHIDKLFDRSTGLFHHGYNFFDQKPMGAFWGRGNGWIAGSIIELVEIMKDKKFEIEDIISSFTILMESVKNLSDENGALHTILPVKSSYLETTATALFSYSAIKGYRLGILDDEYFKWGINAAKFVISNISSEGILMNASSGTGCEWDDYFNVPRHFTFYAQGIALMLISELIKTFDS
ncbi:MAG: glycoside hydrolase family 88 protein [Clostridia bacterium]|nr:glycoside hydrolase family 88 protein [Clostridia bacterium]